MSIITLPTISKGQSNIITLSKAELAAQTKVVASSYFSDQANWNKIVIHYKSNEGNQKKEVVFEGQDLSPEGILSLSDKARDEFNVVSLTIFDFDGGYLKLYRGDLTTSEFDIVLGVVVYSVIKVSNTNASGSDNPTGFVEFNNCLYFSSSINASSNVKLHKIDSLGNITQVSNIVPAGSDACTALVVFNNHLYFRAANTLSYSKLFKLDSNDNITQVTDINSGWNDNIKTAYNKFSIYDNHLYFVADDTNGGDKLYKISSSDVVTKLSDLNTGSFDQISIYGEYNGELLFFGNVGGLGTKVQSINSSNLITQRNIGLGDNDYLGSSQFKFFNNKFYVVAGLGGKIYEFDNSFNVTLISNTRQDTENTDGVDLINSFEFNGSLYFKALNPSGHAKLYRMNTSNTISLAADTRAGFSNGTFVMAVYNNELYFRSGEQSTGFNELFKIDINDVVVKAADTELGHDFPTFAVVYNNELFFVSRDTSSSYKLFKINSSGEVEQVSNTYPTGSDGINSKPFVFNNKLYFVAQDESNKSKLFVVQP